MESTVLNPRDREKRRIELEEQKRKEHKAKMIHEWNKSKPKKHSGPSKQNKLPMAMWEKGKSKFHGVRVFEANKKAYAK